MRTVEICVLHFKIESILIHLLEEVFDEIRVIIKLEAPNLINVLIRISFLREQVLSKILRQCECSVIT